MELLIYGELQAFVPIKEFRRAHNLPESFGVHLFEPKDYTGLGRIDRAGADLNALRLALLTLIPPSRPEQTIVWLKTIKILRDFFQHQLEHINPTIGLRDMEIDFAVSGFESVLEAVVWAVLRAEATGSPVPTFDEIYGEWLAASTRVSHTVHEYAAGDRRWGVQTVTNAYGRVGLLVRAGETTHYVYDASLACPAEGFMLKLLAEVAARILPS